ncbi:hypothetical protein [Vibrio pectenicida]|uniref:hypothetical protein n=1 Tax=Vibrio pectenicida TaxID=62763 RepID=UPI00163A8215|nr:hypothetical protein [Vibrio pectenicida]
MKYSNPEKTMVSCHHPVNGQLYIVPRGNRLWSEFGIDIAEQEHRIDEADPQPELAQ